MGGFTSINNKGDSINLKGFATGIIQGSNVILEYYQPAHISQTAYNINMQCCTWI